MSDVSKTNEALIAEAQQHYSEMNGLNSRAAEVMMELVAALEAKTGVRVDMSSAVGVEAQLAATRVPVQGEPNDEREALRDEFRSYLGDEIYVCSRDHSAWPHGTMGLDDFSLAAEDDEIVESLVQIASRATVPDAAFYGACGVELCETCLPLFDAANREIEGTGSVPDAATAALGRDRLHDAVNALPNHVWDAVNEIADTEGFTDALLAALDGAPEPEWEEVVQYGNLTSAGFLQEIRGRNYAMHKRVVRFGPVLPAQGESDE